MLDKIFQLKNKNEHLSELLQSALINDGKANSKTDSVSVLHQLLANIENNIKKNPKHRRHYDIIKKFATVLYIYSGSMAYDYNIIHKNMPEALPSLRTVQSLIQSQYSLIEEGRFRFDELMEHLEKYEAPHIVAVAEDATHIIN